MFEPLKNCFVKLTQVFCNGIGIKPFFFFFIVKICTQNCVLHKPPLVAQMVKNLPVMQETQVRFLGQEDPLEKGMATHSSILVWRIPWTEEPGGLQSMGSKRVRHD